MVVVTLEGGAHSCIDEYPPSNEEEYPREEGCNLVAVIGYVWTLVVFETLAATNHCVSVYVSEIEGS